MICMEMKNNKMSALKTVNKLLDGLYKRFNLKIVMHMLIKKAYSFGYTPF